MWILTFKKIKTMAPIDERTLLLWLGIVIIVAAVTVTGMLVNRYLTYRAHRRALEDLKSRRVPQHVRST